MIHDPLTPWSGPFPYEVLAPVGVTPGTTQARMRDVPFELMAARQMTPEAHRACKELSVLRTRLLADLLLYDVDLPEAMAEARAEVEEALREPGEPVEVARWLAPCWQPADRLVEELDGVELPPQPEPPEHPDRPERARSGEPPGTPPGTLPGEPPGTPPGTLPGEPPGTPPGFRAALVAQLLAEAVSFDT